MEIEYLSSLLKKPVNEWMLDMDLSRIHTKEEGISLWNISIKLTELSGESNTTLKGLARLRLRACEILSVHFTPTESDKYWLRTSKAFIDSQDFELASKCLGSIDIDRNPDAELKFNFYFWKTQLQFLTQKEYFEPLKQSLLLSKELPNEKFRLARYLYVEVCGKLQSHKNYQDMIDVLIMCQEITQGILYEPLKQIYQQSKLLLCDCFIETSKFEKSEFLLDEIPDSVQKLLLNLKLKIYTDSFDEILKIMQQMVLEADVKALDTGVDMLVNRNKLVDACKCLHIIAQKHKNSEVLLKWFKILFALQTVNGLDTTIEYLNMKKVLNLMSSLSSTDYEYKNLLWDYINELYYMNEKQTALEYAEKFYICLTEGSETQAGLIFCAKCYVELNYPVNALNLLNTMHNSPEVDSLTIRARVQTGDLKSVNLESLKKLPALEIVKVLQELMNYDFSLFDKFIKELGEVLVNFVDNLQHKTLLLKWLCENDGNRLGLYLNLALESLDSKDLEYFFARAWNSAIETQGTEARGDRMMLCLNIGEKCGMVSTADGMYVFINTCYAIISDKIAKYYEDLYKKLSSIPEYLISQELALIQFELQILLKIPIQIALPDDYEYIKRLSYITLSHNEYEYSKMCLEKCLDYEITPETLRELIKISNNFEEAEKYLKIAADTYTDATDKDEVDWMIAVCWNNGVRLLNSFQSLHAKKWVFYSLKFTEKCKHELEHKMRSLYNDITVT
jgi:hypothetical protein